MYIISGFKRKKKLLQNLNFAGLSIHQLMFIQNNDLQSALIPCHSIGQGQFKKIILHWNRVSWSHSNTAEEIVQPLKHTGLSTVLLERSRLVTYFY